MQWKDTATGYGWVSISLHWLTALIVIVMLFVGSSIPTETGPDRGMLSLHTSLGIAFYLVLWFRIFWRFKTGHPGPLPRQRALAFAVGKYLHLCLLVAIAAMLVSGPIMAWAGNYPVDVFGVFAIPSPIPTNQVVFQLALQVHVAAASALAIGVALHLAGSAKHFFFDNDGSVDKILFPAAHPNASPNRSAEPPNSSDMIGTNL